MHLSRKFSSSGANVNTHTLPVSAQRNEVLANKLAGSYAIEVTCTGLTSSSFCGLLPIFYL